MRISTLLLAGAAAAMLTLSAQAADVVYEEPAAPMAVVSPMTWTGFYIGIIGGFATGDFDYSASYVDPALGLSGSDGFSLDGDGGFVGGQAGYDYQFSNGLVLGAVADIAYSQINADVSVPVTGFGTLRAESELQYLGTVRARLGYAATDRFLPYVHGGFAYGETEQTLSLDGAGSIELKDGDVKTGYVVGAGAEFRVTDAVSVQGEYGYTDLGKDSIYSGQLVGGDNLSVDEELQFHVIKAGLNFRF